MGTIDGFVSHRREQRKHRRIFKAANGEGPWPCYCGCGALTTIEWLEGVVHHVDEDRSNNAVENLVPMTWACHTSHHAKLRWEDPDYRVRMEDRPVWNRGLSTPPETLAKLSAIRRKRRASNETRARTSKTMKERWQDPDYRAKVLAARARRRGQKLSPKHCAAISVGTKGKTRKMTRASCVRCHREMNVNSLTNHHRACRRDD